MIIGTGIDIVKTDRFVDWVNQPGLLLRYFHENEIEYIKNQNVSALESLAGRFAAKEAFGKALGTGLAGLSLRNISIENNKQGKPEIFLKEEVFEIVKKNGNININLSIAHEKDFAVDMVILVKEYRGKYGVLE